MGLLRWELLSSCLQRSPPHQPAPSPPAGPTMGEFREKSTTTCGTICFKHLLFTCNCCFWLAGLAGWVLRRDCISRLARSTCLATACILVVAGPVVMVTGFGLLCCLQGTEAPATSVLRPPYQLSAGDHCRSPSLCLVSAAERRAQGEPEGHHEKGYLQPGHRGVTSAVDRLQQEFYCCGSSTCRTGRTVSGSAWARQVDPWSPTAAARPASNIYRVEGGCITKLETLLQEHRGSAGPWAWASPVCGCSACPSRAAGTGA